MNRLKSASLCYLATPYSKYPNGLHAAFVDAAALAARLLQAGVKVYSPIAHTHPLATYGHIDPLDLDVWLPFDAAMMDAAQLLVVAQMQSWDVSRGIAHEIEVFRAAGKPILFLHPETLAVGDTPHVASLVPRCLVGGDIQRSRLAVVD
jgi:hypothetical protein